MTPRQYLSIARPDDADQRARWAAARTQSTIAKAVRRRQRDLGYTQARMAQELGWSRERVSRLISGAAWMGLGDAHALLELVGLELGQVLAPPPSSAASEAVISYLEAQLTQQRAIATAVARSRQR